MSLIKVKHCQQEVAQAGRSNFQPETGLKGTKIPQKRTNKKDIWIFLPEQEFNAKRA